DWGLHGARWAWAHDGVRSNGWFHLQHEGLLTTRWGPGRWRILEHPTAAGPPLLLLAFGNLEHTLRLSSRPTHSPAVCFEVLEKHNAPQDVGHATSFGTQEAAAQGLFNEDALACCATRGWPESSRGSEASTTQ
ncbi:unnamed protein product, partial [Polarella glacialis]